MYLTLINSFGAKQEVSVPDDVDMISIEVYSEWGVPSVSDEALVYHKKGVHTRIMPFPIAQPLLEGVYNIYVKGVFDDTEEWSKRKNTIEYLKKSDNY